jgi:hypothetical protein
LQVMRNRMPPRRQRRSTGEHAMDGIWPYLFRGTSIDWPGNKSLQKVKMTPTSTDALVATLFALECNQHGDGVVYFARWEPFKDRLHKPNVLAQRECEVAVSMLPVEFAAQAKGRISAIKAREILVSMGFLVPDAIPDRGFLGTSINQSDRRLTLAELRFFWKTITGEEQ